MSKIFCSIVIGTSLSTVVLPSKGETLYIPAFCDTIVNGFELAKEFKESPIFHGVDEIQEVNGLQTVVFFNQTTKTFTVMLLSRDQNKACMVTAGNKGEIVKGK